ncbi:MAG TPA: glycogen debranching N-terminal domain-containing protein [Actinomycetota bacterium]|nr:glycogen debranching N-terminal domain-containing protein [Actinomycetota bacterium]
MTSGAGSGNLLVLKEGALFVCSRRDGDIRAGSRSGEGLYSSDTRFLSELCLTIGGRSPVLLSSSAACIYEVVLDLANTAFERDGGPPIPPMALAISRTRMVDDRLYERVVIQNRSGTRVSTEMEIKLEADFADMFEVRGAYERICRGPTLASNSNPNEISFCYLGKDEVRRETIVRVAPPGRAEKDSAGGARLKWTLELEPLQSFEAEFTVEPSLDGARSQRRSFRRAQQVVASKSREWLDSCTRMDCGSAGLQRILDTGINDLRALMTPSEDGEMIVAGIPWYVASFGRDALLTSLEMLVLTPEPARRSLVHLARLQAEVDDPYRDAEPGKILHELRQGELARSGSIPHSPYYGTVDATPLFLMLASAYWRWTADLDTMKHLYPALDAALQWIDILGDRDGDGFVEYLSRSPSGLHNHGWKDSQHSIMHADGSPAEGPIALVEVQGYVYMAKRGMADLYRELGHSERAASLEAEAAELMEAFNEVFWMPEENTFALALDGSKRQVRSVTSNPGHCLYSGIVDADKAQIMARRLMTADMFSGWGVRTLSSRSPAYDPTSYHNGSIWPHDNAIIGAGLKRYGLTQETQTVATALFDAAFESPDSRLPELFCGFDREEGRSYVPYPVACSPQAWAAAAPFMLMQALLGISAEGPAELLTVHEPALPDSTNHLRLNDMRVGDSRVSLDFTRAGLGIACTLLERPDHIRVSIK